MLFYFGHANTTGTESSTKGVLGWREKGRRKRKIRILMNESKLKIRSNSSIEIHVFLSSQFLFLEPSKGQVTNLLYMLQLITTIFFLTIVHIEIF
jgi:hypothetical protein